MPVTYRLPNQWTVVVKDYRASARSIIFAVCGVAVDRNVKNTAFLGSFDKNSTVYDDENTGIGKKLI